MSAKVFANGMEISAKKDGNQSIAGMPDVCLSPPSPPAGPVPIPYPNNAQASDTSDGSKTVKIGGDEVGLKNSSCYKKSTGDEAATKSLGMGVVTHTIQGKMKHAAWSMNVKVEGENAIRHMDLTTHNHMNSNNSAASQINQALEEAAKTRELTCEELEEGNKSVREEELKKNKLPNAYAVTTSFWKPNEGPGQYMKAVSNDASRPKKGNDGYQDVVKEKKMPNCSDKDESGKPKRTGRGTASGRRFDSENKTLDPLMAAGQGGTILMNTFHSFGPTVLPDAMPCGSCRQAICEANSAACNIKVILCTADKPPKKVKADDLCSKDGQPGGEDSGGDFEWNQAWANKGLGLRM